MKLFFSVNRSNRAHVPNKKILLQLCVCTTHHVRMYSLDRCCVLLAHARERKGGRHSRVSAMTLQRLRGSVVRDAITDDIIPSLNRMIHLPPPALPARLCYWYYCISYFYSPYICIYIYIQPASKREQEVIHLPLSANISPSLFTTQADR